MIPFWEMQSGGSLESLILIPVSQPPVARANKFSVVYWNAPGVRVSECDSQLTSIHI